MGPGGYWIVAVLALERADRLVLGIRSGRNDVHDRGVIEVDTGRAKFLRPAGGATLQEACAPGALHDSCRDLRKARTLHRLDDATLLVGRDEKANIAGRRSRNLRLNCRRDSMDAIDPGRAGGHKPDRADVIRLDQVDFGRSQAVATEAKLE